MLLVLNENWRAIFDDMVGPVQKALGEALRSIANKVGANVPYDVLIPKGK